MPDNAMHPPGATRGASTGASKISGLASMFATTTANVPGGSASGALNVAVTSFALAGDDAKARAAGCDNYVSKPFSPRAVLAMVRGYLA
jgi:CheY-like chemotaxis protein